MDDRDQAEDKGLGDTANPAPRIDVDVHMLNQINGVPKKESKGLRYSDVIDGFSSVVESKSTYCRFEDGVDVTELKDMANHIIVGYTSEGLPFQVIINGMHAGMDTRNQQIKYFIDGALFPLLKKYASDLASTSDEKAAAEVTRILIKKIYSELSEPSNQNAEGAGWLAEFTMSVAMTYERQGELYCSGFGIGDTGIVAKRHESKLIEQLVYHTEIITDETEQGRSVSKDAFDQVTYEGSAQGKGLDLIIDRNSMFTTDVSAEDELLGYTLLDSSLEVTSGNEVEPVESHKMAKQHVVVKKILDVVQLTPDKDLYQQLLDLRDLYNTGYKESALKSKKNVAWGGDTSFCRVFIPSENLRETLKSLESQFQQAYRELCNDIDAIQDQAIKIKAEAVINKILDMEHNGEDITDLTHIIKLTHQLLVAPPGDKRQTATLAYEAAAKKARGKPSQSWKALGIAMMVLGVAVTALGVAVIVGTFGLGVPIGVGGVMGGAAIFGLGIYATHRGSEKGLARKMSELAKEQHKKKP